MEYIVHEELEQYSNFLEDVTIGTHRLSGKIAAFSSRYRKPEQAHRIPKGRKGQDHFNRGHGARSLPLSLEGGGDTRPGIPSYLATGVLSQNEQDERNHKNDDDGFNGSAFATSLSNLQNEPLFSIGSGAAMAFQPSRRQRSFSLSSCYSLRRPARRRTSSLGDLNEPSSRVLLMDMIAALNDSFPDHDFAQSLKEQFRDVDVVTVLKSINGYLAELGNELSIEKLWAAVDEVVNLKQCEVFAFSPQDDEDADSYLWYFHYFFFNKDTHSLVYFTCCAEPILRHKLESIHESDESSVEVDDYDDNDAFSVGSKVGERDHRDAEDDDMMDSSFPPLDEVADEDDAEELPDWDGII